MVGAADLGVGERESKAMTGAEELLWKDFATKRPGTQGTASLSEKAPPWDGFTPVADGWIRGFARIGARRSRCSFPWL